MSNWLEARTGACCTDLTNIAATLNDVRDQCITANDDYYTAAESVSIDGVKGDFRRKGAKAFVTAVNVDINKAKITLETVGHVSSATATLQKAIADDSNYYDKKLDAIANTKVPDDIFNRWRDQLINGILDEQGTHPQLLNELLTGGSSQVLAGWGRIYNAAAIKAKSDADADFSNYMSSVPSYGGFYAPPLDPNSDLYKTGLKQNEDDFMTTFHQLANNVHSYLTSWADDIAASYKTFNTNLDKKDHYQYLSARDIFNSTIGNNVDGTQGTDKPVTITPYTSADGHKSLLITIAGTDVSHWWDDTNAVSAIQTGIIDPKDPLDKKNPYMAVVLDAIQKYMDEHPDIQNQQGLDITIAGYSLGGMIAQQFANRMNSGETTSLSKYNLHIKNILTYGAPVMGKPVNGVNYEMYDSTYDPVPLLSSYENPELKNPKLVKIVDDLVQNQASPNVLTDTWNGAGDLNGTYVDLTNADDLPWNQRLNTYLDKQHQYAGHIHAITDVGGQSGDHTVNASLDPYFYLPENEHDINFANHQQYFHSDQLNAYDTSQNSVLKDIKINSLGPTEYFGALSA